MKAPLEIVNEFALQQVVNSLGKGISVAEIAKRIGKAPHFRDVVKPHEIMTLLGLVVPDLLKQKKVQVVVYNLGESPVLYMSNESMPWHYLVYTRQAYSINGRLINYENLPPDDFDREIDLKGRERVMSGSVNYPELPDAAKALANLLAQGEATREQVYTALRTTFPTPELATKRQLGVLVAQLVRLSGGTYGEEQVPVFHIREDGVFVSGPGEGAEGSAANDLLNAVSGGQVMVQVIRIASAIRANVNGIPMTIDTNARGYTLTPLEVAVEEGMSGKIAISEIELFDREGQLIELPFGEDSLVLLTSDTHQPGLVHVRVFYPNIASITAHCEYSTVSVEVGDEQHFEVYIAGRREHLDTLSTGEGEIHTRVNEIVLVDINNQQFNLTPFGTMCVQLIRIA